MENLKLNSSEYVLVDLENNPLESIDTWYDTDMVRWYFYDSTLDEEEINKQIEFLELNGFIEVDYNMKFIRMTDLPKKIQNKYINHYKKSNLINEHKSN
jgi:hypothetical protein